MEKTILISMPVEEFQNIIWEIVTKCLDDYLKKKESSESAFPEIMNIEQAASYLHLSKNTTYKMVQNSLIPVNKKGKILLFIKSELTEWLKTGRRKTISEIQAEAQSDFIKANRKRKKF